LGVKGRCQLVRWGDENTEFWVRGMGKNGSSGGKKNLFKKMSGGESRLVATGVDRWTKHKLMGQKKRGPRVVVKTWEKKGRKRVGCGEGGRVAVQGENQNCSVPDKSE